MQFSAKRLTVIALVGAIAFIGQNCNEPTGPETLSPGLVFIPVDTASKTVKAGEEEGVYLVNVKNNGPAAVAFTTIKKVIAFPDTGWSAYFCTADGCITADSSDSRPLQAGKTNECSFHIAQGDAPGIARVMFTIYNKADPAQKFEKTFTCTATARR